MPEVSTPSTRTAPVVGWRSFMTSYLACQCSDQVAAVAPVAGMRDVPGCKFKRAVPAIAFHGTEDRFVEYLGGWVQAPRP